MSGISSKIRYWQPLRGWPKGLQSQDLPLAGLVAAAILLGGTSQVVPGPKTILHVLSLAMICWLLAVRRNIVWRPASLPSVAFVFCALFALLSLFPLPPAIWANLPGREEVVQGFEALNFALPWLPLSLAPEWTAFALPDLLVPIAIYVAARNAASRKEQRFALLTVLTVTCLTALLGMAQLATGAETLYPYAVTNLSSSVGVFSNTNHQACLLAMVFPLAAYLALRPSGGPFRNDSRSDLRRRAAILAAMIIALGIAFSGSLAGYGLFGFGLATAIWVLGRAERLPLLVRALPLLLLVGLAFDMLVLKTGLTELLDEFSTKDQASYSREVIAQSTWQAIRDMNWAGSGPNTFEPVYRLYENSDVVSSVYIPQAHNDALQLILEFGVIGALTLAALLTWSFIWAYRLIIRRQKRGTFKAVLFIGLVVIGLHSFVDYPLRTMSIMSVTALYLGLLDHE